MPASHPGSPAANFGAMFPYMALITTNAQSAMKKERCQYFDEYGYCIRGDVCPYSHFKQDVNEDAQYDEPMTPAEDPEIDIEVIRVEQAVKQHEHKATQAVMKKTEEESTHLASRFAELKAELAAEKKKLLGKTGDYNILAQISGDQEKQEAMEKNSEYHLEETATEVGVSLDVVNVTTRSEQSSRCDSSALGDAPPLNDASEVPCRYYPNCTKSPFPVRHQDGDTISQVPCKYSSSCSDPSCTFAHPGGRQDSQIPRKFSTDCTNPVCNYVHSGAHHGSQVIRRYHPNCTSNACTFKHPHVSKFDINCRYWPGCKNPLCVFKHPDDGT